MVCLQSPAPPAGRGRSPEGTERKGFPKDESLPEAGREVAGIETLVPGRERHEIGEAFLRIVVEDGRQRERLRFVLGLGRQGKARLFPFLAELGRISLRCLLPRRRFSQREEGLQSGHRLRRKAFDQRPFRHGTDSAVSFPPGKEALGLEERQQARLFQLEPRGGVEIERLPEQVFVVPDEFLDTGRPAAAVIAGFRRPLGQLFDQRRNRLRQNILRKNKTGKMNCCAKQADKQQPTTKRIFFLLPERAPTEILCHIFYTLRQRHRGSGLWQR